MGCRRVLRDYKFSRPSDKPMPSTVSWLDFSESDRRRALEVIELFRDKTTVDELGVGIVRDAISDILFPGTSVIHSRARYFFFIPWMYKSLEAKKVGSSDIAGRARTGEIQLLKVLRDSADPVGTIGVRIGEGLKILPSAIYWQALQRFRIRRFPGTRDQYHRSLDRFYRSPTAVVRNADNERVAGGRAWNWDPYLPEAPSGFPGGVSMKLRQVEAKFLRDRIRECAPGSLYAELLDFDRPPGLSAGPWQFESLRKLSAKTQGQIKHAQIFADIVAGAPFLYNLMLAEKAKRPDAEASHRASLKEWAKSGKAEPSIITSWDRRAFWEFVCSQGGQIPLGTRAFIDRWIDMVAAEGPAAIPASKRARALILDRERQLKRSQARLENDRALQLWQGDSGTRPLTYRWGIASTMLRDIFDGLGAADA